ncbi:MAG: aminotransferase class I/II-fold pyridoxal phosphate-dependent enzyme [Actinomycetota bacterium]|nr:aminotransferase class I/II-fold pyridoxal phosphate-dependent enzyme [Actinomycetota bacterium]
MSSGLVDLRSDTVTRPTPEMRRAMADAEVGDDLYGEDPTVNALEAAYAERVGKEAALYVPSGTMANQLALRVLAGPGTLVIAGRRQHVVVYEAGAAARNAAVQFHLVDDTDGTIDPAAVTWAVEAVAHHQPVPSLVCVENTHMPADGAPWPLERLEAVAEAARGTGLRGRNATTGLPVHLDGARIFNAEVATGVPAAAYAACATTVMSCLSKGLCAPVGSVLAGPADVIAAARVERARLGGQMRQAGIIAAAGLVALRTMVERLADDHRRAQVLAEAVAERWPDAGCDPERIRTNVVTFRHPRAEALLGHLASQRVLAGTIAPATVRLMTHHDVDDGDVERAAKVLVASPV